MPKPGVGRGVWVWTLLALGWTLLAWWLWTR